MIYNVFGGTLNPITQSISSLFLSSFFPRLISAVVDWMSTILLHVTVWHCGPSADLEWRYEMCCTRLAGNAGPKKYSGQWLGLYASRYSHNLHQKSNCNKTLTLNSKETISRKRLGKQNIYSSSNICFWFRTKKFDRANSVVIASCMTN